MRFMKLGVILALPVAFALTLGVAPQPAEAGKACKKIGLRSPCIRKSDIKPNVALVRAWARINADGTVASCWRCNSATQLGTGDYVVDFAPLSTDIRGRPRACTSDEFSGGGADDNVCSVRDRSGDFSAVNVRIFDMNNASNTFENGQFTILIF